MKAVVILNPVAGRGFRNAEQNIARALRRYGVDAEVLTTRKSGDGVEMARAAAADGFELVIAAGGDGTVNEVVNGLVGTECVLGIFPLGTVNVLVRELKIPLDPYEAIKVIASGAHKRIDIGYANGRCFTLMAGFGFDAEVVTNVLQPIKDWIGASAYVFKALETLAKYKATQILLEMPDESYETKAFLVIAANVSTYTYNLKITPHACPDDGLLDICVFERPLTDRIGFMRQVADVFIHRHLYHKAVRYFRATTVKVKSTPEVYVQIDGDPCGTTPTAISIAPQVLPVIVPKA